MPHKSMIADEVEKSATNAVLASMELEHCDLSSMARAELAYLSAKALESYLQCLIENGYTATALNSISNVIHCHNCGKFEKFCKNPDVNANGVMGFCSEWRLSVRAMEGDDD